MYFTDDRSKQKYLLNVEKCIIKLKTHIKIDKLRNVDPRTIYNKYEYSLIPIQDKHFSYGLNENIYIDGKEKIKMTMLHQLYSHHLLDNSTIYKINNKTQNKQILSKIEKKELLSNAGINTILSKILVPRILG